MKAIDYVLLWGYTEDDTIISIRNALSRLGQPVFFINQEYDLTNMQVDVFVDHDVEGVIRLDQNHQIALKSIKAAYLRPGDWRNVSTVGNETVEDDVDNNNANNDSYDIRAQIEYAEDRLWCWSDLTPALVINRVSAMASNGSKPYQSSQIHSVGFEIPDTLITTDPTAVLEFWKYYGKVIYKSISGVRQHSLAVNCGTFRTT